MIPSVFVAGSSAEPARVREAMDAVSREGWGVAVDWLAVIEREGTANDMPRPVRYSYARLDAAGVRRANVIWFLSPVTVSTGAWVELGMALALAIPVVCSGRSSERCIYAAECIEVDSDAEGLAVVRKVLEGRVRLCGHEVIERA